MKKVCFVTNDIDQYGGIERVISLLSFGLEQDNTIEITVLSLFSLLNNTSFFPLSEKTKLIRASIPSGMTTAEYLTIFFRENKFDDLVTFHSGIAATVSGIRKKIDPIRWIATEHCYPTNYTLKRRLYNQYVYRKADFLVLLTDEMENYYKKRFFSNTKVIPNPVPFISIRQNMYLKYVLAVGRIEEVKRFDLLVNAFGSLGKDYPDWKLRIAGNGTQYEKIKHMADQFCNIELLGIRKDIKELMTDSSLLVICSESEAFPLVVLEAMECGLPVVSSELPSIHCMTRGYDAVLFAKQNDWKDLADKIEQMISNPEKIIEMGKEAKKCAEQYHIEHILQRWKEIL